MKALNRIIAAIVVNLTFSHICFGGSNVEAAIRFLDEIGAAYLRDDKLPGMPVVSVDFIRTEVKDADLKHLAAFEQLRVVNLFGRNVTGTGLRDLSNLKNLRSLELSRSSVNDLGLK